MRTRLRLLASSLLAGTVLVSGVGPLGCDDGTSGTTGRRVTLDVKIAASPGSKQFTNARGWSVTLNKAAIATGAFYFYDGDTLFAGASPRRAREWSFVRRAAAHPGHYVPGNAKGEMLTPSSADLLAGGLLGRGSGVTGFVRSATFGFGAPPIGPVAAELGGNVVVLEGVATKASETRVFRVEIAPDEVEDAKGLPQVEGCPFTQTDVESDGTVTITIEIPMWFAQVDFAATPTSVDGRPVIVPEGIARNQLVRGVKGGLAYAFAFAAR